MTNSPTALVPILEIRHDQLVLAPEMPIEGHLGHTRPLDDCVDPRAADAVAIEKIVRGREDPLARRLELARADNGG